MCDDDDDEWCSDDNLSYLPSLGSRSSTVVTGLADDDFRPAISAQLLVGRGRFAPTHNQKIVAITRIAFMPHFPSSRWLSGMCGHKHNNIVHSACPSTFLDPIFRLFFSVVAEIFILWSALVAQFLSWVDQNVLSVTSSLPPSTCSIPTPSRVDQKCIKLVFTTTTTTGAAGMTTASFGAPELRLMSPTWSPVIIKNLWGVMSIDENKNLPIIKRRMKLDQISSGTNEWLFTPSSPNEATVTIALTTAQYQYRDVACYRCNCLSMYTGSRLNNSRGRNRVKTIVSLASAARGKSKLVDAGEGWFYDYSIELLCALLDAMENRERRM